MYGSTMKGQQQQHAVKRFAAAFEVIPRTLAENTAVVEREGNKFVDSFQGKDEASGDIKAKPPSDGMILADSSSASFDSKLTSIRFGVVLSNYPPLDDLF